eukprot:8121728-Alexandrium_andersonii.AAC.1
MSASLVGSEMCIRDRLGPLRWPLFRPPVPNGAASRASPRSLAMRPRLSTCLLYTSDAADDM